MTIEKMQSNNKTVGAGEFKTHCLKLIDEVNQTKQSIVITKYGKPMAELTPIKEEVYSLFGCLESTVEVVGDIVEGTGEVWEADGRDPGGFLAEPCSDPFKK